MAKNFCSPSSRDEDAFPSYAKEGQTIVNDRRLKELWPRLQGKKPHLPQFLDEARRSGIRGIRKLKVPFEYPLSVWQRRSGPLGE